jgi:glycosyltransferase involved in cell wall biosynthesis
MKIAFVEDNFLLWQRGKSFEESAISPSFMLTEWESTMDIYAGELQKLGHECVKYVPSLEGGKVEYLRHSLGHTIAKVPCAVGVYSLAIKLDWRFSAVRFSRRISQENFLKRGALVHYQSLYSSFFLTSTMLGKTRRTVQYTGGTLQKGFGRLQKSAANYLLKRALGDIAMVLLDDKDPESLNQSIFLTKSAGVSADKILTLPTLIVDPSVFFKRDKKEARAALGVDQGASVILVVSAIMQEPRPDDVLTKDPFKVVRIFSKLAGGVANAELHIVGGGAGVGALRELVKKLGLEKSVRLYGVVPHSEVALHISASDLVFVPYYFLDLNYGTAVLEAFASGKPACGFRRTRASPIERRGGFLVDSDEAIAAKELGERLRDPVYLEGKAAEGRRIAQEHHPETVTKSLVSAFALAADRAD